jgi:hypothetical protein
MSLVGDRERAVEQADRRSYGLNGSWSNGDWLDGQRCGDVHVPDTHSAG